MEDVTHDGLVRHLGVVGVCVVDGVVLALAHIGGKGLTVVVIALGLLGLLRLPLGDEVGDPRVRAGGVIRRIAQVQDVLVAADGKAFDLAELRVLQLLAQLLCEMGTAGLVVLERHTETSHRAGWLLRIFKQRVEQTGFFHLHNPFEPRMDSNSHESSANDKRRLAIHAVIHACIELMHTMYKWRFIVYKLHAFSHRFS